ncbi:MAG TPA: tripartite tricarboxylate transporter substrate binding protein [Burkholderiaceae bacterium]|jgi:tripartite-type tricarboxylate transporter receptor subunit TctC|nr:tripartite tricarboxylate transporter substrate binding protein [Burkholderiaceae bacterium]
MKKLIGRCLAMTGLLLTIAAASPLVHAQDYPNRPITWVVGFAPGGVSDQGARFMAKVFGEKLGQPIVIDNKAGAGGLIAAEHVSKANPDGYTILYGSNGPFGSFKSLYKKLPFDPVTSFTYIHGFGSSPLILAVPASSRFKSLKELVDFARANPEKLTYGSVGSGSASHLVAELLGANAGIKLTHVPYKGSSPAMVDMLGGRIDFVFDYSIVVKPQIDAGKVRALGSTGAVRLTSHPDVPTITELGYPGVQLTAWATIIGPAGMPQPVVDKMARAFNEALKDPAVIKFHDDQGVTLMPDVSGPRLRDFILKEQVKFKELVERSGVPQQ